MMPQVDLGRSRARHHGENLATLPGMVTALWAPLAIYTDKNSIFQKAGLSRFPKQLRGERCGTAVRRRAFTNWDRMDRGPQSASERARIERLF